MGVRGGGGEAGLLNLAGNGEEWPPSLLTNIWRSRPPPLYLPRPLALHLNTRVTRTCYEEQLLGRHNTPIGCQGLHLLSLKDSVFLKRLGRDFALSKLLPSVHAITCDIWKLSMKNVWLSPEENAITLFTCWPSLPMAQNQRSASRVNDITNICEYERKRVSEITLTQMHVLS